jgi:hypothetical protein
MTQLQETILVDLSVVLKSFIDNDVNMLALRSDQYKTRLFKAFQDIRKLLRPDENMVDVSMKNNVTSVVTNGEKTFDEVQADVEDSKQNDEEDAFKLIEGCSSKRLDGRSEDDSESSTQKRKV